MHPPTHPRPGCTCTHRQCSLARHAAGPSANGLPQRAVACLPMLAAAPAAAVPQQQYRCLRIQYGRTLDLKSKLLGELTAADGRQHVTIADDRQGVGCAPRSACRWNRPADSLPCLLYRGTMVFLCRPAPVERTRLSVPCLRYVPRAVRLPFHRHCWRHRHRCCVRHSLPAGWTTCWPPFSPPEGGAAMLISSSPPRSSCSLPD